MGVSMQRWVGKRGEELNRLENFFRLYCLMLVFSFTFFLSNVILSLIFKKFVFF